MVTRSSVVTVTGLIASVAPQSEGTPVSADRSYPSRLAVALPVLRVARAAVLAPALAHALRPVGAKRARIVAPVKSK